MKKIISLLFLSFIAIISLQVLGLAKESLTYSVLNEEFEPGRKSWVNLSILLSGEINKTNIESLLNKTYQEYRQKGYSGVGIKAYLSKEHYEGGGWQWVSMLDGGRETNPPKIDYNQTRLNSVNVQSQDKFGLTEEKRKRIWYEIIRNDNEVQKQVPSYPEYTPYELANWNNPQIKADYYKRANANQEIKRELVKKYMNEIALKYKLTTEQLREVENEAKSKGWAMP